MAPEMLVDIRERNKELIRKRTDISEHFTREVIQSIVFIFLPLGERVHLTNLVYYYYRFRLQRMFLDVSDK